MAIARQTGGTRQACISQRAVKCARCNKDVTDEAGVRGQAPGAQYVCESCRRQEKVDPQALLDRILGVAGHASPALPGAPSIRGYRIERELGRGGMGVVYKATAKSTGRTVAIKTMLPDVASNENAVATFLREVEVTRQVKHPNIVELRPRPRQGDVLLRARVRRRHESEKYLESKGGKIELKEAAPIMMDVLAGLGHAHSAELRPRLPVGVTRPLPALCTAISNRRMSS